MRKKCSFFIGLVLLLAVLVSSFRRYEVNLLAQYKMLPEEDLFYGQPTLLEEKGDFYYDTTIPYTGKTYIGFKQALGVRESNGLYKIVNSYGYMGKYQFGKMALHAIGITDSTTFLEDPVLQEKALDALLAKNKWILRKEIRQYNGKRIGGIDITESGLLAAAHLGGAGSVKRFLRSNGTYGFNDGYGTSIRTYLKKFSGYDVSDIQADKDALVSMR